MNIKYKYEPINCDFYDHFEIHAMRKTWLKLLIREGDKTKTQYSKIVTLNTKDKSEYATLIDYSIIRLDHVVEMTPINVKSSSLGILLDKLDYNLWANDMIIKALRGQVFSKDVIITLSHVFNALDIWNTRMKSKSYGYTIWQEHDEKDWKDISMATFLSTVHVLNQYDIMDMISYINLEEERHQSSVYDIVTHLVNHSTYHRGQIIKLLQIEGLNSVSTDYIDYTRVR